MYSVMSVIFNLGVSFSVGIWGQLLKITLVEDKQCSFKIKSSLINEWRKRLQNVCKPCWHNRLHLYWVVKSLENPHGQPANHTIVLRVGYFFPFVLTLKDYWTYVCWDENNWCVVLSQDKAYLNIIILEIN